MHTLRKHKFTEHPDHVAGKPKHFLYFKKTTISFDVCIIVEEDLKRFSCEQCEFTSDRRYSLQRHMERKHPDLKKTGYNLK